MDIKVDEAEPEDSINRCVMDTTSTGEEALYIPPHWHKVSKRWANLAGPVIARMDA